MTTEHVVVSAIALGCYLVLVAFTLRRSQQLREIRYFTLYLVSMLLWQITALTVSLSRSAPEALFWYRVMMSLVIGQFFIYFQFTRAFRQIRGQRWAVVTGLLAAVGALIIVVSGTPLLIAGIHRDEVTGLFVPDLGPLLPLFGSIVYFSLGCGVFNLVRGYRRATSYRERNRLRYLLTGIAFVIAGTVSNFVPALQGHPIDIAANIINAGLIAAAILRHQLLDIRIVVRKGLVYSVPTAIIGAGYYLIIFLATRLFGAFRGPEVFLISLVVAVITALAVQPLRDRAQRWIDRLFFREKYDVALMLQRLSRTVASVLDLDRLANMILDEVTGTVHVDKAAFFVKEETSGEFRLMAERGLNGSPDLTLRSSHPVVAWLSSRTDVFSIEDIDVTPQFRGLWGRDRAELESTGAELLIPLRAKGELMGVFAVGPKLSEESHSLDDQRTLTMLANQTAMAIDNARLFEEAQRRARELAALNRTGQAIASTLDVNTVLAMAMGEARSVARAEAASALLYDEATDELVFAATSGGGSDTLGGKRMPASAGIAGWVVREGQPVMIHDAQNDPRFYEQIDELTGLTTRSLLAVPLKVKERVIGVIEAINRTDGLFDKHDLNLLDTLGGSAAAALENAQLYQEVQRQADDLAAAVARLQELDRLKNEFIQNASHELRMPVALIMGYAEMLDMGEIGELEPEQRAAVGVITRRARMLRDLVEDITLILQVETHLPDPEPVWMDELAQAIVEEFQIAVHAAGLTLDTDIAPHLPPVGASPTYLRRVLDNLIGNAIKFTPEGGTITVRAWRDGDDVALEVRDTGIGIPADRLGRVFERFYQVDGSATRRYGGVGLGLALMKEVVEAYGGRVAVDSEMGVGSTFAAILPALDDAD